MAEPRRQASHTGNPTFPSSRSSTGTEVVERHETHLPSRIVARHLSRFMHHGRCDRRWRNDKAISRRSKVQAQDRDLLSDNSVSEIHTVVRGLPVYLASKDRNPKVIGYRLSLNKSKTDMLSFWLILKATIARCE